MAEDIFQLRYTVPGLGYFVTLFACVALFFPDYLWAQCQSYSLILAGIAAVGTIPAGYLINQFVLLWEFIGGRYVKYSHMEQLGQFIFARKITKRKLKLRPIVNVEVTVSIKDLRKELKKLGREYLQKVCILDEQACKSIRRYGWLAPLHDVIFSGSKVHDRYLQTGWMHSNTTRVFLLALSLATVPWIVAACARDFRFGLATIVFEFVLAAEVGWIVYRFTRADVDLKEKFLTWLYAHTHDLIEVQITTPAP